MPCLQQRNTDLRFTSCTRSQASTVVSRTDLSSSGAMPALLKSTSIRPNSSRARAYMPSTCSGSVTSAWIETSPTAPSLRSTPTTFAPSDLKSAADSAPIPLAVPVMTQTLPAKRPMVTSAGQPAPRSDANPRPPASRNDSFRRVVHVLQLRVVIERVGPELASEARLLEAPEGRAHAHGPVRVDGEHTGLDGPRDAQRLGAVASPDRAGEAVDRVVGEPHRLRLVTEGDDAGDRTEDLLARRAVVVRHGAEHRGREPVAPALGGAPANRDGRLAVHVRGHRPALRLRDQGAHLRLLVQRVADLQGLDRFL